MLSKQEYLIEASKKIILGKRTGRSRGFNGADYDFVKSLIRSYDKSGLTPSQCKKLKEVLMNYKKQLERFSVNYRKIARMKFPQSKKDVSVWFKEDDGNMWMAMKTPYNEDFIANIKSLNYNLRQWNSDMKVWEVKLTHDKETVKKAIKYIEENYNTELNIDIPDVSFGTVKFEDGDFRFNVEKNKEFIDRVKNNIHTSRWNGRRWIVRPRKVSEVEEIIDVIEDFSINIAGNVLSELMNIKEKIKRERKRKEEIYELSKKKSLESDYDVDLPTEDLELYPFQKYGVKMLDLRGKGLLSDSLGLGKTIEVLAHLYNHQELRPVIVICPSSVKINWKREIIKWAGVEEDDISILDGQTGDITEDKDWYLVNYAILHHRLDDLLELDYESLVVDESHFVKEYDSERTKASLKLAEGIEHTYLLSGTPMPNRPIELWTQLEALNPVEDDFQSLWGNDGYEGFAKKYCGAYRKTINGNTFWDMKGSANTDELYNKLVRSIMIRRKKEDVLDELPKKRRFMIPLEIENRGEYNEALRNFKDWMDKQGEGERWKKSKVLVKMGKLKQLAWEGKYQNLVEWIDDILMQTDKLVVFAHHQDLQDKLYQRYEDKAIHLTSGMSSEKRQNVIDEFTDNEDIQICVASIKAGGVGINLQVADIVVFTEILWSPSDMSQCEGRVHRIGSESDQVDIYYLMGENTVEESMFETINEKQKIIDESIDGVTNERKKGILIDVLEDMNVGDKNET